MPNARALAHALAPLLLLLLAAACDRPLEPEAFKREAERAYQEAHPGWSIKGREGSVTYFVRGDQLDTLDVGKMFADYQASKRSGSAWLEGWAKEEEARTAARRRSLDQAKQDVVPVLKSGAWVRVQDLGAIGPQHLQDKIRPWRKEVAPDLYVLLGIPEDRLGLRLASIDDVKGSKEKEESWVDTAVANLRGKVGTSTASEIHGEQEQLLVYDLSGYDAISGLLLDAQLRARMLDKFGKEELGAAVPIRDVLIFFDPSQFTATRPVRARTHQLYDTQNHPAFRGLLRFDKSGLSILEAANPEKKKPAATAE